MMSGSTNFDSTVKIWSWISQILDFLTTTPHCLSIHLVCCFKLPCTSQLARFKFPLIIPLLKLLKQKIKVPISDVFRRQQLILSATSSMHFCIGQFFPEINLVEFLLGLVFKLRKWSQILDGRGRLGWVANQSKISVQSKMIFLDTHTHKKVGSMMGFLDLWPWTEWNCIFQARILNLQEL